MTSAIAYRRVAAVCLAIAGTVSLVTTPSAVAVGIAPDLPTLGPGDLYVGALNLGRIAG
jgi:hypothetical protein